MPPWQPCLQQARSVRCTAPPCRSACRARWTAVACRRRTSPGEPCRTARRGCAVHTKEGSVVVDPGGRLIDGRYYEGQGNGRFCPPGQAKKGNC